MDLKPPIVSLFQYSAAEEGNEIMFTASKKKKKSKKRVGEGSSFSRRHRSAICSEMEETGQI